MLLDTIIGFIKYKSIKTTLIKMPKLRKKKFSVLKNNLLLITLLKYLIKNLINIIQFKSSILV